MLYEDLKDNYDFIFPLSKDMVEYFIKIIKKRKINGKVGVLDIGCATGSLAIELSKIADSVVGIDLDVGMINIAKSRLEAKNSNVIFKNLNAMEIGNIFSKDQFDVVSCLGNTLVHLDGVSEIDRLFSGVRKVLKKDGLFIIQIINYDYILKKHIDRLSDIVHKDIKFERYYKYNQEKNRITFETKIINSNETLENKVELYPFLIRELENTAAKNGFNEVKLYSSYKKDEFNIDNIYYISEIC